MKKKIQGFISIPKLIIGGILLVFLVLIINLVPAVFPSHKNEKGEIENPVAQSSFAHYKFNPSGAQLVTGNEQTILAQTAGTAEGVNLGSWRALLGDDALHWGFQSTTGGYDAQVIVNGAQLNGANTLIIQTEIDEDATAPATVVQICDFVSSTNVDHAASANCTTGGWRTLNNRQATIAPTTSTNYSWSIYNGYFDNGSASLSNPISTDLSNFINGSNQVVIRYYSATNTTSVVHVDYLRVYAVVSPVYYAADSTVITGTEAQNYTDTTVMTQGGGTDTQYSGITGTGAIVPDMYYTMKNVKTYTGMNTIMLMARHACTSTNAGHTYRFKIYNFNSTAWEDLTTTSIACSTTAASKKKTKNNVTVANYINGSNEMRVGIYGLAAYVNTLRVDGMYVMLGTTNTSTSDCQITMGTVVTGDCANTRNIDTTATVSEWILAPETESTTEDHDFYPGDHDTDATASEVAQAAHMKFNMTKPNTGYIVGVGVAARVQPRTVASTGTQSYELRDYQNQSLATSRNGFMSTFSGAGATYTFSELYISGVSSYTCGVIGCYYGGGVAYVDSANNQVWFRSASSADGTNGSSNSSMDFVMLSFFWTEDTGSLTERHVFTPTAESIITGTQPSNCSQCATADTTGIEIGGGWQALLADDGAHMGVISTAGGYNAEVTVGGVALNGANMMMVETELELDITIPQTLVQICDWVSSTGVDHTASGGCSTGGWRTLNYRDAVWNNATATQFHWQFWNGYWSNGSNAPYSTPLTNFVNGSGNVLVRYYSTTSSDTSVAYIDFLRVGAWVHPIYGVADFTAISTGTVTNDYTNVYSISSGTTQVPSDDNKQTVANNGASTPDFYYSFTNVEIYTGMNSLIVRAEHACVNTGGTETYRAKIYNFDTTSWEALSSTITCSTTDATNIFAKNNVDVTDYISSGEVRVGFDAVANFASTDSITIDMIYLIMASTNADSGGSDCFISFGTLSSGDCTNTRNIDTTTTASQWIATAAQESNTFGTAYYAFDNDQDITQEYAGSQWLNFPLTKPDNVYLTSVFAGGRFRSSVNGTVMLSMLDYSGSNTGVTTVGSTANATAGATTTAVYSDPITIGTRFALSGCTATGTCQGINGFNVWPEDIVNTVSDKVFLRLRNSAPGAAATNNELDFAFVTMGWVDTIPEYTVSGSIYQSGSESTLDTTAYTVALSVNNGSPVTTTASAGTYSFPNVGLTAGDQIAVYIQGNANDANSISEVNAANQTVNLYVDRSAIYHSHTDATTNVEVCGQSTYPASGDNLFTCSSNVPTYTTGGVLVVDEYSPGGDVNSTALKIGASGTYTGVTEILTLSNSGTGASRPFVVDGTYTPDRNFTRFTGTSATEVQATTYATLQIYPASGTQTYTLGTATSQTITVNEDFVAGNGGTVSIQHDTYDPVLVLKGDMTIHSSAVWVESSATAITFSPTGTGTFTNNGGLDNLGVVSITGGTSTPQLLLASGMNAKTISVASSHTLNAGGTYTITIYGTSGVMFTNNGTFTPSTSTVLFNGDGSTTLNSGSITFNNLTFSPELSTNKTYNFDSGTIVVNDDLTISPTSSFVNNNALSVILSAGITVADRISINPSSTAYGYLYTNAGFLTSGSINLQHARATFDTTDGGIVTLTGTSTPFSITAGTFNETDSLVKFTGNGTFTLSSGVTEFQDLEFSPTITTNRVYTLSSSAVTVAGGLTVNPTGSGGTYELQVDMANTIDVNGTLSITKNTSATSEWNTTGTNFAIEAGKIDILSGGTLTANGSTITLTGASTPFALAGGATFTAGTSTVVFNANSAVNPLTSGTITFNNVTVNPIITADRSQQFTSASTITFTGDVSIAPSASTTPREFTFNMGGIFSGGSSSDIDVNPSGTATAVFNTNVSNYAVTMQSITIDASTTWEANASTVTLTGAVSLPFTDGGTHNAGSATYVYTGDYDVVIDADTYGSVTLSPTLTNDRMYSNQSGTTTVMNSNFSVTPTAGGSYNLEFNFEDLISVTGATTLNPTGSATASFDTDSSGNYGFTTGDMLVTEDTIAYMNVSNVDINGDLIISSTGTFVASPSEWTLAGDYTNNGAFTHSNGTLLIDGTSQQTFSGNMLDYPFYNVYITNNSGSDPDSSPSVIFTAGFAVETLSVETADVKIRFQEGETFTVLNSVIFNGQDAGTRVALRSSSSGTRWYLNVTSSAVAYNTDVKDSDASGGITVNALDSSNYDSTGNTNWDFTSFTPSLTFSISDNTIGFGNLSSGAARYATGDNLGTGSETVAHTFDVTSNAPSGYLVTVSGATLTDGAKSINAIGGTSAASSTGSEQFGIRITASGGTGTASSPYNHGTNYAYDGVTIPDEVASDSAAGDTTTYSVRYLGNISAITEAGSYSSTLTYIATGNF